MSGSPGRLSVECRTVASLIRDAYLSYTSGEPWPQPIGPLTRVAPSVSDRLRGQEIKGSPAWVNVDCYTIEARAEGTQYSKHGNDARADDAGASRRQIQAEDAS